MQVYAYVVTTENTKGRLGAIDSLFGGQQIFHFICLCEAQSTHEPHVKAPAWEPKGLWPYSPRYRTPAKYKQNTNIFVKYAGKEN